MTRIAVMGAGGIGALAGGLLARAGHDVTLIDPWPEHVDAIKRGGLRLTLPSGDLLVQVRAIHLNEAQAIDSPFEVVLLCVKAYDTDWATAFVSRFLTNDGVIISVQNGLNEDRIGEIVGRERTMGCIPTLGAQLEGPGHVARKDAGGPDYVVFTIGELDGAETERLRRIATLLSDAALTRTTTDLYGQRWSKLTLNCMVNPIAGLTGYGTREVMFDPVARKVAIHLGAEVLAVAAAAGHPVESVAGMAAHRFPDAVRGEGVAELEKDLEHFGELAGTGRSSFVQDVAKGRRTEIDELTGYVVAQARRLGLPVPVNEAILEEVIRQGVVITPSRASLERVEGSIVTG